MDMPTNQQKDKAPEQQIDAASAAAPASSGLLDNFMPEAEFQAFLKTLPESTQWLGDGIPRDCEPWRRAQVLGT